MTLPTCSAFSLAARTSLVSWPSVLFALLNCLPALPICLARPSTPPPVPGTFTPSTFLGFLPNLLPSSAPPTRPAAVPTAATTVVAAFDPAPLPEDSDCWPPFPFLARFDAPEAPLFGRFAELERVLLRDAAVRVPPPLRELLALLRDALDFVREGLDLLVELLD